MNQIVPVRVRRRGLKHVDGHRLITRITLCTLKIAAWVLRITAAGLDATVRRCEDG